MTPDEVRAAYRVLFTKVLGHRDGLDCPRCVPWEAQTSQPVGGPSEDQGGQSDR